MPKNRSKLVRRILKNYTKVYLKSRKIKSDIEPGDKVVVGVQKKTFHRGFNEQFSDSVHSVVSVDRSKYVPMYKLKSDLDGELLEGFFYREEIQKVTPNIAVGSLPEYKILKKRGAKNNREVYIQWKGFPKKFNSWISLDLLKMYM